MSLEGYTKSFRSKWGHNAFRNLLEAAVWAWMCDSAAWRDCRVNYNGQWIELKRGQLVVSRSFISQGFRMTDQEVRHFLALLAEHQMVTRQTTSRGTIITITNYDKYQEKNQPNNQPITSPPPAKRQNKKEGKNNSESKDSSLEGFGLAVCQHIKPEVWDAFIDVRKKKKAVNNESALASILRDLERWQMNGHDPNAVLEKSIRSSWKDVYEPKETQNANTSRNTAKPSSWTSAGEQLAAKYAAEAEREEQAATRGVAQPSLRLTENLR